MLVMWQVVKGRVPGGRTAGTQAPDPREFLARLLTRIPDPGQAMTRPQVRIRVPHPPTDPPRH
jgi:hypothetical protein